MARGIDRCRRAGVLLATRTSFEVGGEALEFYIPADVVELAALCRRLVSEGRSPHVLGGGCNTLFPDGPFARPVVSTERLRSLRVEGTRIRAGAGVRMSVLLRTAIESGLAGLEWFAGIPGSVGGAIVMNAGGSGRFFGALVERLTVVELATGEVRTLAGAEVRWDYRTSHLDGRIVASADLALEAGEPEVLRREAREWLRRKAAVQPLSAPSGGCVFKNTPVGSAGALIDRAGLKGAREGAAVVSERHANFILNEGGRATARDILTLLERVRGRVEETCGVRLETELVIARDSGADIPGAPGIDGKAGKSDMN